LVGDGQAQVVADAAADSTRDIFNDVSHVVSVGSQAACGLSDALKAKRVEIGA
jgi:hypothetical protein